jgi:hypothetical protein
MTKITNTKSASPAAGQKREPSPAVPKAARAKRDGKARGVVPPRRSKAAQPAGRQTKLADLIAMLREKRGASIDQLVKATGWQKHSVRGAISGALKKKLGLKVVSEKTDAGRTYRIVG